MIVDGVCFPVSERFWWFSRRVERPVPQWIEDQEEGVWVLITTDCNNDRPCKYARSRGE